MNRPDDGRVAGGAGGASSQCTECRLAPTMAKSGKKVQKTTKPPTHIKKKTKKLK
jgi:hypothetical protein